MNSEHTRIATAGWLEAQNDDRNAFAYEPLRFHLARVLPDVDGVCVSQVGGSPTILAVVKSTLFLVEVDIEVEDSEKAVALRIERHHLSPEDVVVSLFERTPANVAHPRREREWKFLLPRRETAVQIKSAEFLSPSMSEGTPNDERVARQIAAACGWQFPG